LKSPIIACAPSARSLQGRCCGACLRLDQLLSRLETRARSKRPELPIVWVKRATFRGFRSKPSPCRSTRFRPKKSAPAFIHGAVRRHFRISGRSLLGQNRPAPNTSRSTSRAEQAGRDLARRRHRDSATISWIYDLNRRCEIDPVGACFATGEAAKPSSAMPMILEGLLNITRRGKVAGCRISEGKVLRGAVSACCATMS